MPTLYMPDNVPCRVCGKDLLPLPPPLPTQEEASSRVPLREGGISITLASVGASQAISQEQYRFPVNLNRQRHPQMIDEIVLLVGLGFVLGFLPTRRFYRRRLRKQDREMADLKKRISQIEGYFE